MDLLERASALGSLRRWHADAQAGLGRLVLLEGEAGVGKTSLVAAFTAQLPIQTPPAPARTLRSGFDGLTSPRPLGPLVDLAPALDERLARLLGSEAYARDAVFDLVLEWLSRGPVRTLILEDLHWADETTVELLRFLAHRVGEIPALVIVSFRDDELEPMHPLRLLLGDLAYNPRVERLALQPLSPGAVAELAEQSELDAERLYQVTGGNPFFVTEILATGHDVPGTVRDAVLARAARLSPQARKVLDAAAVVTPPIDVPLLLTVAAAGALELDECVTSGMLREHRGEIAFRHDLARLAIERSVGPGQRFELHRRTLEALLARPETTHDPTRLAHHGDGAGDTTVVLRYGILAAQRAADLAAHRSAAAHYKRVLGYTAGLAAGERAEVLERHSYECYLIGRPEDAADSREQALACWRAIGDKIRQGDTLRWLSRLAWFRGDGPTAERTAEAAVDLLEGESPGPELAMAYSNLSQLSMLDGDARATRRWSTAAIELATQLGRSDIEAHALNNAGSVELLSDPDTGRAMLVRSLQLASEENQEEHVARAFNNLVSNHLTIRDLPRAEHWIEKGLAYLKDRELDSWRLSIVSARARVCLELTDWSGTVAAAREVLHDPRCPPPTRLIGLTCLARARVRQGDDGAWSLLEEARSLSEGMTERPRMLLVAVGYAEAAWLTGKRKAEAGDLVTSTLESMLLEDGAGGWARSELADWCRRLGLKIPVEVMSRSPYWLSAQGDFVAAASRWADLGYTYESALSLSEASNQRDLRESLTRLHALGARPAAAAVGRRLRDMGVRNIRRGPQAKTRVNPANLTEREMEVLELLTEGLRNTEIASRLFISTRTAGNHVSAILGKLGVRSRAEAVRLAAGFDLSE